MNAFSAALLTRYAGVPPCSMAASEPASLETLTMRPRALRRSRGSRISVVRQGPSTLVSHVSCTTARSAVAARCQVS